MSGEPQRIGQASLIADLKRQLADRGGALQPPLPAADQPVTLRALSMDPEVRAAARAEADERNAWARWERAIPPRFHEARLADFVGLIPGERIGDWSTDPGGRNLVILGPVGTGKSHLACAAIRAASDEGATIAFKPIDEMLEELRPNGPERALDALTGVDLLVIDDVGGERATEWTAERLYAVVNRRWLDERPTIITSNLDRAALETHLGARTFSRLVGDKAIAVVLSGQDRRRAR
jgi:hypothetical protein